MTVTLLAGTVKRSPEETITQKLLQEMYWRVKLAVFVNFACFYYIL